jgi:hypothetical protein
MFLSLISGGTVSRCAIAMPLPEHLQVDGQDQCAHLAAATRSISARTGTVLHHVELEPEWLLDRRPPIDAIDMVRQNGMPAAWATAARFRRHPIACRTARSARARTAAPPLPIMVVASSRCDTSTSTRWRGGALEIGAVRPRRLLRRSRRRHIRRTFSGPGDGQPPHVRDARHDRHAQMP